MYEVEQKFSVEDLAPIEDKLRELGASIGEPQVQVDRYFAHPARDFGQTDEALRIRQIGQRNFVTYKGPKIDQSTKTRREIELPLVAGDAHAQQFSELLAALSFASVDSVRKTRRVAALAWHSWQVEVALDEVDRVGPFVEIELQADEPQLDAARAVLGKIAQALGLEHHERRSYLELLLESHPD